MARRRSNIAKFPRPPRQVKVYKAEGREHIKTRQQLLAGKAFQLESTAVLPQAGIGCVGEVRGGTVVRVSTVRTSPLGKLYFFDGFELKDRSLHWIGEFDILDIEPIVVQCGREVCEDVDYDSVYLPDTVGVLSERVGDVSQDM